MGNDQERHEYAKWIFEQNLHWISASEVKTGAIVAIDTAMLGALVAVFSALPSIERTVWDNLSSLVAAACLLIALFCAGMSVFPRTGGPPSSFVFFGAIVKRTAADYHYAFRHADGSAFLDDCIDQIYRNAQIACTKFRWVRNSTIWSFVALVPWVIALASLRKP